MRILITGTAGFIGFHLAKRLCAEGHLVTGIDGMTTYYDVTLKRERTAILARSNAFRGHEILLEDMARLRDVAEADKPEIIIHLAAQAGVRYSLENPRAYVDANLVGTFNILEVAREIKPKHLLIASTSSVYGANSSIPFRETDRADQPLTLYAATKKAGEVMAHSQAHLYQIPTTLFRFFTVYGPWGRPDMAYFKFVRAMLRDEPIDIYGQGQMSRDFTYIDDLVEGIVRLIPCLPETGAKAGGDFDSISPVAPHRIVNIGGGQPVALLDFVAAAEKSLGIVAKRNYLSMQPGDVPVTFASADLLERLTGFKPSTPIQQGVDRFVAWYREHYRV
ncbi:MAG: NAD-dependent epimerase/dehydratase family protein [Hyphomicrobiales bacterium]